MMFFLLNMVAKRILHSSTISSKYGHLWLQEKPDGDGHNAKLEDLKL